MHHPTTKTILLLIGLFLLQINLSAQGGRGDTLKIIQAKPTQKSKTKPVQPTPGEALGFVAGLNGVGVQFGFHPK
jgi:hypothetical protein